MKLFRKKWFWICLVIILVPILIAVISHEKGGWLWRVFYQRWPSVIQQTPIQTIIPVHVHTEYGWPPKWEYMLMVYDSYRKKSVPKGATLTIEAIGIDDGSVTDKPARPEFGAWQVKEIAKNHITFISNQETPVPISLPGFHIVSSNGKEGVVQWIFNDTIGGSYSGATEGPFPKD